MSSITRRTALAAGASLLAPAWALMGVHQDVATRLGPAALQAAGFVPPR